MGTNSQRPPNPRSNKHFLANFSKVFHLIEMYKGSFLATGEMPWKPITTDNIFVLLLKRLVSSPRICSTKYTTGPLFYLFWGFPVQVSKYKNWNLQFRQKLTYNCKTWDFLVFSQPLSLRDGIAAVLKIVSLYSEAFDVTVSEVHLLRVTVPLKC